MFVDGPMSCGQTSAPKSPRLEVRSNHNNLLGWGQVFKARDSDPISISPCAMSASADLNGFKTVQRMLLENRLDVIQFGQALNDKWRLSEVGMAIAQSKVGLN